jgi:hypothetical protein
MDANKLQPLLAFVTLHLLLQHQHVLRLNNTSTMLPLS